MTTEQSSLFVSVLSSLKLCIGFLNKALPVATTAPVLLVSFTPRHPPPASSWDFHLSRIAFFSVLLARLFFIQCMLHLFHPTASAPGSVQVMGASGPVGCFSTTYFVCVTLRSHSFTVCCHHHLVLQFCDQVAFR